MEDLDLNSEGTIKRLVEALSCGSVVGGSFDPHLYILAGNARDQKVDSRIRQIKGEGRQGYLSVWLPFSWVAKLRDSQRIGYLVRKYLEDTRFLEEVLSGMALLRYSVVNHPDINLPEWLVSRDDVGGAVLQQFCFRTHGNDLAFKFQRACELALTVGSWPGLVGATSMNLHNAPTIIDPDAARDFCRNAGLELCVHNGDGPKYGSYPLLKVGRSDFTLDRYSSCSVGQIDFFRSRLPNFFLADLGAHQI